LRRRLRRLVISRSSAALRLEARDVTEHDPRRKIRKLNLVGLAIIVFLFAGVGGWAAATQLAGAVIAPGTIVVESSVKKVQHPTGGVVGEILVREGAGSKPARSCCGSTIP